MFKLIVQAAIPFLAATAIAQAGEVSSGRITYVNPTSHEILVDNVPVQLASSVKLENFGLGALVHVVLPTNGDGARLAAYAPIVEQKATGRITFIQGDLMVVNNTQMQVPAGADLSAYRLSNRVEVTYTSVAGLSMASNVVIPSTTQLAAVRPTELNASGRITFVDFASRTVMIDSSTRLVVPATVDMTTLRVADQLDAHFLASNGKNIAVRLASL